MVYLAGVKGAEREDPGLQAGDESGAPSSYNYRNVFIIVSVIYVCNVASLQVSDVSNSSADPTAHETYPRLSVCIQPFIRTKDPGV